MKHEETKDKTWEIYKLTIQAILPHLEHNKELPGIHGWIARDKDGLLGFYSDKPQRFDDKAWWCDPGCYTALALPPDSYPEITWESEPLEIELLIRPKI